MPTNDKTQARSRRSLGPMLLEVFFIMLGVMVALAANEWREGRALDKRTDVALENIRLEILRNQATLQLRLPYHQAMSDSIRVNYPILRDIPFEFVEIARLGMARGPFFESLYNTAWQTALTSQILPNVDYETLTLLATIYQTQDELKEVEHQFSSIIFLPENMEKGKAYHALLLSQPFINGVVKHERELLSIYDTTLRRLNPDAYVPAPPND